MEQSNNKNIIIALLVVIIVILGGFCILFATGKLSFNSDKGETTEKLDLEGLPEWAKYILDNDSVKISYIHPTDYIPEEDYSKCPRTELTKENLKDIFKEMSQHKLIKTNGGIGFIGSCYAGVEIKYNNYTINITNSVILNDSLDSKFVDLLDAVAEVQDVGGGSNYWYTFSGFQLQNFVDSNILNK